MVESDIAVPVSSAPPPHAASDSETLTSTLPVNPTDVPCAPRLSYRDVATNAVPTEQSGRTPNAPLSPEGKGPAPCVEDTASAELAVTSCTGVSFSQPSDLAIRADHIQIVRSLLPGLSFEDKCGRVGVAPLASGLCIATAAGEGGAIVPITATARRTAPAVVEKHLGRKKHTTLRKLANEMID